MTVREHRQPDKRPHHLEFTEPTREKMKNFCGDPDFESR